MKATIFDLIIDPLVTLTDEVTPKLRFGTHLANRQN